MSGDLTLLGIFFAGLLSFLSPCVLPLVPPYLTYLARCVDRRVHTIDQWIGWGCQYSAAQGPYKCGIFCVGLHLRICGTRRRRLNIFADRSAKPGDVVDYSRRGDHIDGVPLPGVVQDRSDVSRGPHSTR